MKLTNEQDDILRTVSDFETNIHINAVPGSAKTTTCLCIARTHPLKRILLLTYNKRLRLETLQKLNGLNNIHCHTFHSFGYSGFHETRCKDDIGLEYICKQNNLKVSFSYDLLIIDEAQDMTLLLYRFVKKCYSCFVNKCPIVVLGDSRQCIFSYKGADPRFLTRAPSIFDWNVYSWVQKTLSVTFRCSPSICDFINSCLTPSDLRLTPHKNDNDDDTTPIKPVYMIFDTWNENNMHKIVTLIETVLIDHQASLNDILILFASVKQTSTTGKDKPVKKLCNMLSAHGYSIAIQFDHSIDIDDEILQNKIWIANFHKVKGIERKHVFVFDFDSSYFTFYGKNMEDTILPNIIYVALSRASCTLHVINHERSANFAFVKREHVEQYCTYNKQYLNRVFHRQQLKRDDFKNRDVKPSKLCEHIDTLLLSECIAQVSVHRYNKGRPLLFSSKTKKHVHGSIENVSDINSEIVNILLQRLTDNTCNLKSLFWNTYDWLVKHGICHETYVLEDYETYDFSDMCAVTYLATAICSYKSDLIFRLKQLHSFNWFSPNMIQKTYQHLRLFIDQNVHVPLYEQGIDFYDSSFKRLFVGFIDCYDIVTDTVFEFKCTNTIENTHIIQTLVYRYMVDVSTPDTMYTSKTSSIYNMKTNERVDITASHETIRSIIENILQSKNNDGMAWIVHKTDDEFIQLCLEQ